ncbi:MAG: SCO family protein [Bacteroidia bacterium]|nr:SCO family protein [Bacteroidia bacterium]MBT8270229.1 SCO family protein [Bacteroidia bacterium]NNF82556.1 SCO family protein [Flavobacteriaceae bacterium]NNK71058.1 SCO family protein [Flavobacteriaceae bacterium]NNL78858.1 SCO family protein [Flavobacteriaceae bacterium]
MNKTNYSYVGIAFIILVFGIWAIPKIVGNFNKPELEVIGKAPEFSFINQDRETISDSDYIGKVYVVEFFFTTCPSICPIMNRRMVEIQDKFFGNPNLGIASFTITPDIDTPEVLKAYADKYGVSNPNWNFLTGEKDAILKLSNEGYNLYAASTMDEDGDFSHSGLFALIDKEGNIRSRYDSFGNPIIYYRALDEENSPNQIKELMEDIAILLDE